MRRRAVLSALPTALLAACATGPLGGPAARQPVRVVFFADDSAEPATEALSVIQDAATVARNNPGLPVRVLGFSAPADQGATPIAGLSARRAERVAAELERFGIPRSRIVVQGRGPVPFEAAAVESRRVEIHIGN